MLVLHWKEDSLKDSRKEEDTKRFHNLQVIGMKNDLRGRVGGLGRGIRKLFQQWYRYPDFLRAIAVIVFIEAGNFCNQMLMKRSIERFGDV